MPFEDIKNKSDISGGHWEDITLNDDAMPSNQSLGDAVKNFTNINKMSIPDRLNRAIAEGKKDVASRIAKRQNPWINNLELVMDSYIPKEKSISELVRVAKNFSPEGQRNLVGGLLGNMMESGEAAISNPIRRLQNMVEYNSPVRLAKEIVSSSIDGAIGKEVGKFEDIYRSAGFSDTASKFFGFLDQSIVFDAFTKGRAKAYTKQAEQLISKNTPQLTHNSKWIKAQAELADDVLRGVKDTVDDAYTNIYDKISDFPVNSDDVYSTILNSSLDGNEIKSLERIYGKAFNKVSDIGMARELQQRLKASGVSFLKKPIGKGGTAAARKGLASMDMKGVIKDSVRKIDPLLADDLTALDKFAEKNLYPNIEAMEKLTGKGVYVEPEKLVGNFRGLDKTKSIAEREVLSGVKEGFKKAQYFTTPEFKVRLSKLIKNSHKLLRNMEGLQNRQIFKNRLFNTAKAAGLLAITSGAAGGAAFYAATRFMK